MIDLSFKTQNVLAPTILLLLAKHFHILTCVLSSLNKTICLLTVALLLGCQAFNRLRYSYAVIAALKTLSGFSSRSFYCSKIVLNHLLTLKSIHTSNPFMTQVPAVPHFEVLTAISMYQQNVTSYCSLLVKCRDLTVCYLHINIQIKVTQS